MQRRSEGEVAFLYICWSHFRGVLNEESEKCLEASRLANIYARLMWLYILFFFFSLGGGQSAYNPDGGGVGWLGSDSQIV